MHSTTSTAAHTSSSKSPEWLLFAGLLIAVAFGGVWSWSTFDSNPGCLKDPPEIAFSLLVQDLQRYKLDMGHYPSTAAGLTALLERPAEERELWRGPYTEANKLQDNYGERFQYARTESTYILHSAGADMIFDTDDDDFYPRKNQRTTSWFSL